MPLEHETLSYLLSRILSVFERAALHEISWDAWSFAAVFTKARAYSESSSAQCSFLKNATFVRVLLLFV